MFGDDVLLIKQIILNLKKIMIKSIFKQHIHLNEVLKVLLYLWRRLQVEKNKKN